MVKSSIVAIVMGIVFSFAVLYSVKAQTGTMTPSPTTAPTGVMPTNAPSTGRG